MSCDFQKYNTQIRKCNTHAKKTEIYRCTEDTLNNGYELSSEQTEVLEQVQEKIKEPLLKMAIMTFISTATIRTSKNLSI